MLLVEFERENRGGLVLHRLPRLSQLQGRFLRLQFPIRLLFMLPLFASLANSPLSDHQVDGRWLQLTLIINTLADLIQLIIYVPMMENVVHDEAPAFRPHAFELL